MRKFESRWMNDKGEEFVRRVQHVGGVRKEQYFLLCDDGQWFHGPINKNRSADWWAQHDNQRMWEVEKFTPIKGIKTFTDRKYVAKY